MDRQHFSTIQKNVECALLNGHTEQPLTNDILDFSRVQGRLGCLSILGSVWRCSSKAECSQRRPPKRGNSQVPWRLPTLAPIDIGVLCPGYRHRRTNPNLQKQKRQTKTPSDAINQKIMHWYSILKQQLLHFNCQSCNLDIALRDSIWYQMLT